MRKASLLKIIFNDQSSQTAPTMGQAGSSIWKITVDVNNIQKHWLQLAKKTVFFSVHLIWKQAYGFHTCRKYLLLP